MANKKRKQSAKQKELTRIKRFIKRTEKKGYRYSQEFKESLQNLSWQKLRTFTTKELYKQATALSDEEDAIISGTQKRIEEKRKSAKKAQQTRQEIKRLGLKNAKELGEYKKRQQEQQAQINRDKEFEEQRREQDRFDREKAEKFQEGQLVYDQIIDLINQYPTAGSYMLQTALNSEIGRYGQEVVIRSLAEAPEHAIQLAQDIVYYEDTSEVIHSSLLEFINIIRGTVATSEEAKETGETMDAMSDMVLI